MNCYNHPEIDAIGVCKSCSKGVCRECVVDLDKGLACKNSCEEDVRALNELLAKTKTAYQKTGKAYSNNAIIYVLLGGLFLILGLASAATEMTGMAFLMIPAGLIFTLGAVFNFINGRRIGRVGK